jgi:hypothetical protein
MLLVVPLYIFLAITLRHENGNGRVIGHCHLDAFMILNRIKTRAEHVMGLGMG